MGIPLFHFLQAIDIILTVNLKFYLAFQCTRILLYAIKHGFKTLRSLTHGKEQQTTIIQVHPQPQPDSALLDWDIDEIAVPVLEPKRPSLIGKLDLESGELLDGELDELRIPILEPKRNQTHPTTSTFLDTTFGTDLTMSKKRPTEAWDGKIQWAIKGPSIFDDEQEELDAILSRPNLVYPKSASDLWIFQYGLRYMPPATDKNAYRTVKIDPLPPRITLNQLLAEVQGLDLYSARLLNTKQITGSNTAILIFIRQADTVDFLHRAKSGLQIASHTANVSLVNTPTYPIPAEITTLISTKGYSRCLVACDLRECLQDELRRVLHRSPCWDYVEGVDEGFVAGEVYVRFHSVQMAAVGLGILSRHPCFANSKFRFQRPSVAA